MRYLKRSKWFCFTRSTIFFSRRGISSVVSPELFLSWIQFVLCYCCCCGYGCCHWQRSGIISNLTQNKNSNINKLEQECIPVGCVLPACCPYLPACTAPGSVPVRGCTWSWGVYLVQGGVPTRGVHMPGGVPAGGLYLPRYSPRGQTDTCKNITFANPHTRNSPLSYSWCVNKFQRVGSGGSVLYRGRPGSCTYPWPCSSIEDPPTCPFSLCGKNEWRADTTENIKLGVRITLCESGVHSYRMTIFSTARGGFVKFYFLTLIYHTFWRLMTIP